MAKLRASSFVWERKVDCVPAPGKCLAPQELSTLAAALARHPHNELSAAPWATCLGFMGFSAVFHLAVVWYLLRGVPANTLYHRQESVHHPRDGSASLRQTASHRM